MSADDRRPCSPVAHDPASFAALWRFEIGVIPATGAGALAGLIYVFALKPLPA